MEVASNLRIFGSMTMALATMPSLSASNLLGAQSPTRMTIGPIFGRSNFFCGFCSYVTCLQIGFDRRGELVRRVGNERTKATIELLHNVLAYLKPVNSDNESQNLKNRCSATYNHFDIHEARLEYELKDAAWLRADAYSEQQPFTRYPIHYQQIQLRWTGKIVRRIDKCSERLILVFIAHLLVNLLGGTGYHMATLLMYAWRSRHENRELLQHCWNVQCRLGVIGG
uniref:Uncharacterized protein n=1 Tax=Physcomitrium patens TaxID=3218 RepID=A0A2K1JQ55_PHYPA|nr:hypothetical protein PHYPA_016055 [Physcomitrium patens]